MQRCREKNIFGSTIIVISKQSKVRSTLEQSNWKMLDKWTFMESFSHHTSQTDVLISKSWVLDTYLYDNLTNNKAISDDKNLILDKMRIQDRVLWHRGMDWEIVGTNHLIILIVWLRRGEIPEEMLLNSSF